MLHPDMNRNCSHTAEVAVSSSIALNQQHIERFLFLKAPPSHRNPCLPYGYVLLVLLVNVLGWAGLVWVGLGLFITYLSKGVLQCPRRSQDVYLAAHVVSKVAHDGHGHLVHL